MKGIQCYAGYKLDDNYAPTHIIVVMMNEMTNRTAAREGLKKALLTVLNSNVVLVFLQSAAL